MGISAPAGSKDATLVVDNSDGHRAAIAHYLLRAAGCRMAADCERMLDELHLPDRKFWREAVGEALVASRHLLALLPRSDRTPGRLDETTRLEELGQRVQDPRNRIVDAMSSLLRFVPVSADEELLLHDARSIRETALDLFVFRARGASPGVPDKRAASAPAAPAVPAVQSARILVADDEPMLRTMLSRMLKKLGYEVVLAEHGRAALEMAQRERFDLILTDINMPELDGIELLRLLKSAEQTRDVPVIVISSQDDLSSVSRCIELGAEDHLSKPYEPMLLQARVRAALERKRMRDLEIDYLRRVGELTAAAQAVEREVYVPGSLGRLADSDDELGRLARVFDRMVSGLKSREERLQHRLRRLRHEMGETGSHAAAVANVSLESPFASGEILATRYEILAELGKGGMGMVYRAHDRELGEDIAVKVVRRDLVASDRTLVDRLKSEIRLARRISHRNVVRSHDLGESNGTYFITMEYVEGITVANLLDRRGRLTIESTLAIGTQLADALAVAHEIEIIHRDIKPANLLIAKEGVLKVMDFGLARAVKRDASVTLAGFIVGTPQYMSPEQFMGTDVDARSDLFAVGVVLYECLAGRTPFEGDSVVTLFTQIVDGAPIPLRQLAPDIPPRLDAIIHQLIQRKPEDRVATARELSHRLAEIEHSSPDRGGSRPARALRG